MSEQPEAGGSRTRSPGRRDALAELATVLPTEVVVTGPAQELDGYRADRAPLAPSARPLAVVRPRRTEQVAAALRWAAAHSVPVVPRGAGTGLAGGAAAVDGCLVLCMADMTR